MAWITNHSATELFWTIRIQNLFTIQIPTVYHNWGSFQFPPPFWNTFNLLSPGRTEWFNPSLLSVHYVAYTVTILNTRLVWYSNGRFVSGCEMVRYSNGDLKTRQKKAFTVQNVRYSNGQPSHVTLPFEYLTPILFGIQMNLLFKCSVFRWLQ